jgi:hypothetical protein
LENEDMTTETKTTGIDSLIQSDEEAVIASFVTGEPLARDVAKRVHERAERIRERVFRTHGLVDIGVPAIRELRGELP